MIKLRLMRFGAKKKPSYRIVAIDSTRARQSKTLDTVAIIIPGLNLSSLNSISTE